MNEKTIYSYTVIYAAPAGFEEFTPYVCAVVSSDSGERTIVRLQPGEINIEELSPGIKVKAV
ncbi:MAG: OB-fold domain-containing protein [Clostridiales Family XIII bacterium]|jgi:uncharacterized OB-fold protein|nr:OB-fold domain-containing protein [Clostridiales Family XIII bacterium]